MAFGDIRPDLKPQERKRKIAAGYSSGMLHFLSLSRTLGLVLALKTNRSTSWTILHCHCIKEGSRLQIWFSGTVLA